MPVLTLIPALAGLLLGYVKSKGVYDEYLQYAAGPEFKNKQYLPVGLYWSGKINLFALVPKLLKKPLGKLKYNQQSMITELYGYQNAAYYASLYEAKKALYALLGLALPSFMGCLLLATGDGDSAAVLSAMAVLLAIVLPLGVGREIKSRVDRKRMSVKLEFPEFINKLTLLVNAGMTVSKAWEKVVLDGGTKTPLYRELTAARYEIISGKTEAAAYADFAQRCRISEIVKCVSMIISNLKKGGDEVVPALKMQVEECWQMRKANARIIGEQAGTKLLLPLMIMLIGIIIIVIMPAVMMLGGI